MDRESLEDLFRPFGPVLIKRMFGGWGIFADALMFGLYARGNLYLKAMHQVGLSGRRDIVSLKDDLLGFPDTGLDVTWAKGSPPSSCEQNMKRILAQIHSLSRESLG